MKIADLTPDPANRRKHTPRNMAMLTEALRVVGASRSIVIDETGEILAGNGVVEAAKAVGLDKVTVVDVDGDTIVAVRRSGLDPEAKRKLAMYDNRVAELAEWNWQQLGVDRNAGLDLVPFFTEAELAAFAPLTENAGLTDPDAVPEVRETTIVRGTVFALGPHRVMCGDATAEADVQRVLGEARPTLMVTDPPYGVNYDPSWRNRTTVKRKSGYHTLNQNKKKQGKVVNDDQADWRAAWQHFPGPLAYVWHSGLKAAVVQLSLESCGFVMRTQIIWTKERPAISRGDYHWQHEPCWHAVREGATGLRTADRSQVTVWPIHARDDAGNTHGTQKPVECMARPMRNHLAEEVYDPFVGSGTTVIAAEMLGRRCYAMDLEPSYVQVTIDRWEAFTGTKAEQVS